MSSHIIKRKGRKEAYDERKIYASVYASALNSHLDKVISEKIAEKVSKAITGWVSSEKQQVSSEQIFREVTQLLKKEQKDVAFMYETHRDLS